MSKVFLRLLFVPIVLIGTSKNSFTYVYVVKEGNSLSKIAGTLIPGPVWGIGGSFKPLLEKNKHIKNPDYLRPGDIIHLPISFLGIKRLPASNENSQAADNIESSQNSNDSKTVFQSNFERGAQFGLSPYYKFSGVTSTSRANNSSSTLASSYNTGIAFNYTQKWSENFDSFFDFNLGSLEFEKPYNNSGSIINRKKYLSGFGMGFESSINSNLAFQARAGIQKEVFLRVAAAQSLTVDSVSTPFLGTKGSYDVLTLSPFSLGFSSSVYVNFPAKTDSYNSRLGTTYSGIIYLKQYELETGKSQKLAPIEVSLAFSRRLQSTSFSKQSQTDLGVSISYQIPVGGREKKKREGDPEK